MNEIIKKNGITFGIIYGVFGILLITILYAVSLELLMASWLGALKFIIYSSLSIYLLIQTKKQLIGNISFKDAFVTHFLFSVIGLTIVTIYELVLYRLVKLRQKHPLNKPRTPKQNRQHTRNQRRSAKSFEAKQTPHSSQYHQS